MNHTKLFWLFGEKLKSQVRQKKIQNHITARRSTQMQLHTGGGEEKKDDFLELIIKKGVLHKEITKKLPSHLNKKW